MNSKSLPQKLEIETLDFELKASLVLALERTNTTVINIENTISDIKSEFSNVDIKDIQKALRNGGLGKYGRTFKFSTQEICIWIREHLKEKEKNKVAI